MNDMKKIWLICCCLILSTNVFAQEVYNSSGKKTPQKPVQKEGFSIDDMIFGGDFRLTLGSGYTSLGIAPMVGIRFTNRLSAGVRVGYSYNRVKDYYNIFNFNTYSGSLWGRCIIFQNVYAHVEAEYNIYDIKAKDRITSFKDGLSNEAPSILLGLGLKQPITERTSFNLTLMYDVLKAPNSYYHYITGGGFDMRAGILVGF
jgi:hypothetical protein